MASRDTQINLRIPSALKRRIEDAASASGRSMNAEIAYRLERSFGAVPGPDPAGDVARRDGSKVLFRFEADGGRFVEIHASTTMDVAGVRAAVAAWVAIGG